MASASDSRLTALAVPLAMSLARDSREAESLLRARSEEMLFLGIVRRREQALQELREAQAGARALAVLHESASAPHGAKQTFSSVSPLVHRCVAVVRQQVSLLDGSLRDSISRLRALAAELEQNAIVNERVAQELSTLMTSLGQDTMRPLAASRLNVAEIQRALARELLVLVEGGANPLTGAEQSTSRCCAIAAAGQARASLFSAPWPRPGGRGVARGRGGPSMPLRDSGAGAAARAGAARGGQAMSGAHKGAGGSISVEGAERIAGCAPAPAGLEDGQGGGTDGDADGESARGPRQKLNLSNDGSTTSDGQGSRGMGSSQEAIEGAIAGGSSGPSGEESSPSAGPAVSHAAVESAKVTLGCGGADGIRASASSTSQSPVLSRPVARGQPSVVPAVVVGSGIGMLLAAPQHSQQELSGEDAEAGEGAHANARWHEGSSTPEQLGDVASDVKRRRVCTDADAGVKAQPQEKQALCSDIKAASQEEPELDRSPTAGPAATTQCAQGQTDSVPASASSSVVGASGDSIQCAQPTTPADHLLLARAHAHSEATCARGEALGIAAPVEGGAAAGIAGAFGSREEGAEPVP